MKRTVQTAGIVIALLYAFVIVWLYLRQPRTFEEIKTQAAVEASLYQVKQENFDEALRRFNAGQYRIAAEQFEIADPARRDPTTQFYIAYSYYRLGRGNFSDDDEMFNKGLAAVDRAIAAAPNNIFEIDRADLDIRSAAALRERLREGLEVTASDFNPLNWFKKD
jgi:tetratricopeptide (TPR) repeat protein